MSDYSKKLKHPLWARRAAEIKESAGWRCENCQSDQDNLQVHHLIYYVKGREPWEYERDTLLCLCEKCHLERGKLDASLRYAMAQRLRFVPNQRLEKVLWEVLKQAAEEVNFSNR